MRISDASGVLGEVRGVQSQYGEAPGPDEHGPAEVGPGGYLPNEDPGEAPGASDFPPDGGEGDGAGAPAQDGQPPVDDAEALRRSYQQRERELEARRAELEAEAARLQPLRQIQQVADADPVFAQGLARYVLDYSGQSRQGQQPPQPPVLQAPEEGWASDTEELLAAQLNEARAESFAFQQRLQAVEQHLVQGVRNERTRMVDQVLPDLEKRMSEDGLPDPAGIRARIREQLAQAAPNYEGNLADLAQLIYEREAYAALRPLARQREQAAAGQRQQGSLRPPRQAPRNTEAEAQRQQERDVSPEVSRRRGLLASVRDHMRRQ